MKSSIKKKWVAALRSGKYRQVEGNLKVVENGRAKHCCLGVLCELYAEAHPDVKWTKDHTARLFLGKEEMPDARVRKWAGLDSRTAHTLARMNDDGEKFPAIALHIEKRLKAK